MAVEIKHRRWQCSNYTKLYYKHSNTAILLSRIWRREWINFSTRQFKYPSFVAVYTIIPILSTLPTLQIENNNPPKPNQIRLHHCIRLKILPQNPLFDFQIGPSGWLLWTIYRCWNFYRIVVKMKEMSWIAAISAT